MECGAFVASDFERISQRGSVFDIFYKNYLPIQKNIGKIDSVRMCAIF